MTRTAQLVDLDTAPILGVLGPTVQRVVADGDVAPCVIRGTVPPGVSIGLHSHPEPETFIALSGALEGYAGDHWELIRAGDVFHIPPDIPHGFRNRGAEPAVMFIVTTGRVWRFFEDVAGGSVRRFIETAERYGHWLGTPEDNAAVGIELE
jgi:quercetin dioxygenase-like cupin family protein